jgi:hypothetical protein
MNRLQNYQLYIKSATNIKINLFQNSYYESIVKLNITAGLYKPSMLYLQHSLILSSIVGQPPIAGFQVHGKRMRRTASLYNKLNKAHIFPVLHKIIYEVMPILSDFKTPK